MRDSDMVAVVLFCDGGEAAAEWSVVGFLTEMLDFWEAAYKKVLCGSNVPCG